MSYSYGLVTWLSVHHPFENLSSPTYHVDPLGLTALMATLLVLALLGWAFVHVIVSQSDMGNRCRACGYRIVGSSESCSECGRPHPDPAVVKRRTGLGRIVVLAVAVILWLNDVLYYVAVVSFGVSAALLCFAIALCYNEFGRRRARRRIAT